jgi:hypothetical protein
MQVNKSKTWALQSGRRQAQRAQLLADGRLALSMSDRPVKDILLLTGLTRARMYRAIGRVRELEYQDRLANARGAAYIDTLLL